MRSILFLVFLALLALLGLLMPIDRAAALPGDIAHGKRLHEANCMACHDTGMYTRNDRVVLSLDALKQQLTNCSHMAAAEFSKSDTQDLLKYLNDEFYRFR